MTFPSGSCKEQVPPDKAASESARLSLPSLAASLCERVVQLESTPWRSGGLVSPFGWLSYPKYILHLTALWTTNTNNLNFFIGHWCVSSELLLATGSCNKAVAPWHQRRGTRGNVRIPGIASSANYRRRGTGSHAFMSWITRTLAGGESN